MSLEVHDASASECLRGAAAGGHSSLVRADVLAAAALGRTGCARAAHAPAAPHLRRDRRETRYPHGSSNTSHVGFMGTYVNKRIVKLGHDILY